MEKTVLLSLIASGAIAILWIGLRKMCPNCHRWNGLKKISSKYERTEKRYRSEIKKHTYKDSHGRITHTKETNVNVPYNVTFYNIEYECGNCKKKVNKVERINKYLREGGIILVAGTLIMGLVLKPSENKYEQNKKDHISSHIEQGNSNIEQVKGVQRKKQNVDNNTNSLTATSEKIQNNKALISSELKNQELPISDSAQISKVIKAENNNSETEKSIVIKDETPEKTAISMLKRGKEINEIEDSTHLSKKQIRRLRKNAE